MKEQHYKNHIRIAWGFYLVTGVPVLILLGLAIAQLINGTIERTAGLMFILAGWVLFTMLFRIRGFALKAQDRAIRAEENFRHYLLTGKTLDPRLSIKQIIALRFASDEELPSLAQKAAEENMSNKDIKQSIMRWKADWWRV